MTSTERALTFQCGGEDLIGILHTPPRPDDMGVIVIVGGPQYRAGSHRQFVLLARAVAAAGHAVLRFDCSGMGDSGGPARTFEQLDADIESAIDAMQAQVPEVKRIVLWGLCDGASAALLYVGSTQDPRVKGLCVLNPWVRSEASLARTHVRHYYAQRLTQRAFWMKLLAGGVGPAAWRGLLSNFRAQWAKPRDHGQPYQTRMARAWAAFGGDILLILSGNDLTAREFSDAAANDPIWAGVLEKSRLVRHELPGIDHTFSNATARAKVEEATTAWVRSLAHELKSNEVAP